LRELIKMVVVLTVICACSALLLSYANQATKPQREYQLLKYVEEPSIKAVLPAFDNDPIKDRVVVTLGKNEKGKPIEKNIFPAKEHGKLVGMAYSGSSTGYHGPIEVMVGLNMQGKLTGIAITQQAETPGLGARVAEPAFTKQFKGLDLSPALNLSLQGGKIDSVSGASESSKAVVRAVRGALELFPKIEKEVG
jgi:electron transport complex protein RnfG